MNVIKTKSGELHWKLPNVIEAPRFMGSLDLSREDFQNVSEFEIVARVIERMGIFVKLINVKSDGVKIEKYEDLFELREWRGPLYKMANQIIESLAPEDEKKKAR